MTVPGIFAKWEAPWVWLAESIALLVLGAPEGHGPAHRPVDTWREF